MRIQSNFKDYYDRMQAYTFGKSSVYTRAWVESLKEPSPESSGSFHDSPFYVGFCGKLYCGRRITWHEDGPKTKWGYHQSIQVNKYFFDIVSYEAHKINGVRYHLTKEEKRKVFNSFGVTETDTPFIKDNSPILFFDWNNDICCPLELKGRRRHDAPNFSLESIGFETIINAESAYTELCGYITGVLELEHKEVPEMENSVKIESHGFNKKSFRRQ